jgi:hypothetical protein
MFTDLRARPIRHFELRFWIVGVITFHEKAGRSQVNSFVILFDKVFSGRVAAVAMLPSALSRSESVRSVHVGRSRFNRCCHLISDLSFHSGVERGPGD